MVLQEKWHHELQSNCTNDEMKETINTCRNVNE